MKSLGFKGFTSPTTKVLAALFFSLFLLPPQPVEMMDWSPIPAALLAPSSATKAAADPATKAAATRPPTHLIPPWLLPLTAGPFGLF